MPHTVFYLIVTALMILLLLKIITAPIHFILKLLLNGICGLAVVMLLNLLAGWTGVLLALNWVTVLIVAVLGLPGVGALLILHFLFL